MVYGKNGKNRGSVNLSKPSQLFSNNISFLSDVPVTCLEESPLGFFNMNDAFMDPHAGTEPESSLAIGLNHGSLFQCLVAGGTLTSSLGDYVMEP